MNERLRDYALGLKPQGLGQDRHPGKAPSMRLQGGERTGVHKELLLHLMEAGLGWPEPYVLKGGSFM